ncbi:MAG: hypothetical protein V4812_18025 [Pseudomonadota bacterium]
MRILNRWKIAFFSLLSVFVSAIAIFGYCFIDMAYTMASMNDGYDRTVKDLERLSIIFPKEIYDKKDILHLLRKNNKEEFIVETDCKIQLDGLRFEFNEADKLIGINTRGEYESETPCVRT